MLFGSLGIKATLYLGYPLKYPWLFYWISPKPGQRINAVSVAENALLVPLSVYYWYLRLPGTLPSQSSLTDTLTMAFFQMISSMRKWRMCYSKTPLAIFLNLLNQNRGSTLSPEDTYWNNFSSGQHESCGFNGDMVKWVLIPNPHMVLLWQRAITLSDLAFMSTIF